MRLNKLFRITAVMAVVFAFVACDEDFTEIGGEIITNPSNVELREVEVNAYSQKINSIQTNNLNNYFLGSINHPVYGESTANIVTQVSLSPTDPDFGENVQLDSVVMTIPYYSTEVESTGDESEIEYRLDSIYGNGSFNLKIYETGFFLNDLDPDADFEQRQKYYSDQQEAVEQNIIGEPLYVENNFEPSNEPYVSYELNNVGENDTITNTPAFRVKLPIEFFQQKIIDREGSDDLSDNSGFKNYFRSLLIAAESNGSGNRQILLNLASQDAKISLYYTSEVEGTDGEIERARGTLALNIFGNNRFNTYTGEFPANITQLIENQSAETGAENLYLKGQEGSIAVIELFPDSEVLENLKEEELLINEAELTFYVNEDLSGDILQPRRLYIFDLTNNSIIADYALDASYNPADPEQSLTSFSQPLKVAEDGSGSFYKLRITNHVSNIINEDSDNVKLGLVVVPNINTLAVRDQQGGVTGAFNSATKDAPALIDQLPSGTLLTPYGTVLHGNLSADDEKRLKLNIFYTNFN
ncbi:DUF4270 domain-containing protein [Gramella sp. MAR_2010_147]|uniref:DUF4270 domain-containing protein n=1 Tax=Gramella sp. MAR_2010_147 TaxID=1250205 RepID=UPI00087A89B1|nr:DUF4270 domain-containing protein [Gramella sp. MAR_2010_147]SDS26765.1 protein of unknown function [Gramella sp. MAR_2010_147]